MIETSTLWVGRRNKKKKKMQARDDSKFYSFVTQAMSLRLLLPIFPGSSQCLGECDRNLCDVERVCLPCCYQEAHQVTSKYLDTEKDF